jgi:hypothetical protein
MFASSGVAITDQNDEDSKDVPNEKFGHVREVDYRA